MIEMLSSPEVIGMLGVLLMLLCLTLGIPIAVSLGMVGIGGLALLLGPEAALIKAGVVSFETISRYELGVLPLFLLMANLCFRGRSESRSVRRGGGDDRAPTRRTRARVDRRLCGLRRDQRLEPRDRRDHRPGRAAGNAPARLLRHAGDWRSGCGGHARVHDPAVRAR